MEEENIVETPIENDDEDLELDKSIQDTIASLNTKTDNIEGGVPSEQTEPETTTDKTEVDEDEVDLSTVEKGTAETQEESDLTIPIRGKFETDTSYAVRMKIAEMIKAKKQAETVVEKNEIQEELRSFRKEFGNLINNNKSQLSFNNNDNAPSDVTPEKGESGRYIDESQLEQILSERETTFKNKNVVDSFFKTYKEFNDDSVKQVFIDFFDSNYRIDNKVGEQITETLELAREAMFRPKQGIQERVLKSADVNQKINSMQFPGGTVTKSALTPQQQKSVDEMVNAGVSEEKARELISD